MIIPENAELGKPPISNLPETEKNHYYQLEYSISLRISDV